MKITFCGADRAVTGSCHCLEACGKKILVDCGLQQGRDEIDNTVLPFSVADIDCVVLTHAHIDHSGRLPLLTRLGYRGPIHATRLTAQLCSIMLQDSAHIQEQDAAWANNKGRRAGKPAVEPLYTSEDASACLGQFVTHDYGEGFSVCDGVACRFVDAGHLLGSAYAQFWADEGEGETKIAFSGDIGNRDQPILRDPSPVEGGADYVVMESTYGCRTHEGEGAYTEELAQVIDRTLGRGGNVVIPSFAVGRTQEVLYFIREMKEQRLVKSMPDFPVYVDSPLAKQATTIFSGDLTGYIDEEAKSLVQDGVEMLRFPGLNLCETLDESKALNTDQTPKVILSASGMCDAGRVRHHLKYNLWRPECAVVFVGYQADGTLGRTLLDGAKTTKILGEEVSVKAEIVNFRGLSSHADSGALLGWISAFDPKPRQVFVVHGDYDVAPAFAEKLRAQGLAAHAPELGEIYDLKSNSLVQAGKTPVKTPKAPDDQGETQAFSALQSAEKLLAQAVDHNRGGTNGDLAAFAEELRALVKKWDR